MVGAAVVYIAAAIWIVRDALRITRNMATVIRECGGLRRLAENPVGFAEDAARRFTASRSLAPAQREQMKQELARAEERCAPSGQPSAASRPGYAAALGHATTPAYRETFFRAYADLEGKVRVHHAVEQQTLSRYPGVVTTHEMHSLENLRGTPIDANGQTHLTTLRRAWNEFYRRIRSPYVHRPPMPSADRDAPTLRTAGLAPGRPS